MYVVTVDFRISPEHTQDFQREMLVNARSSVANEAGCRRFDVSVDEHDPAHFFLFEVYDDEAAFQTHMTMPHFHKVNAAIGPRVIAKAVATFLLLD